MVKAGSNFDGMRRVPPLRVFALCASLAVLAPDLAHSQSAAESPGATTYPAVAGGRTLNGHRFLPAADAPWPFTVTNLTSYLIVGYGETTSEFQILNKTFGGTRETDLGGGIFYTGRKDLAAGVQFVSRRFAVVPNVDVSWKTYLATTPSLLLAVGQPCHTSGGSG